MRRRPPRRDDPGDDEEADEAEESSDDTAPRRGARRGRSVRKWDPDSSDDDEEADRPGRFHLPHAKPKERVFYRARDSFFFEPLVALAIIVLMLVSLYAYTSNWPPLYVVESSSMQHGDVDQIGLINTGDLVLAQKASLSQITPYVVGLRSGYETYGEYGDVLLYNPNGLTGGTPIIHRAIVYLEANPDGSFNAPELAGIACGSAPDWVFSANSTGDGTGCATTNLTGQLTIRNVGWQSVYVVISLGSVGDHSGFVTMGDNNFVGNRGTPDEPVLTSLVDPSWVVGVARGMVPWFGAIKLVIEGNAQYVPSQSWEFLGLTVVALVLLAAGIHYLLRAGGIEDPRRKAEEEAAAEADDDERPSRAPPPGGRSWRHPLRNWDPDEEADDRRAAEPPKGVRRAPAAPEGHGRPRPRVGRRSARKTEDADDPDEGSDDNL